MRIKLEDLPDEYRKQAEKALTEDHSSIQITKQKQRGSNALGKETTDARINTPVHIIVYTHRTRENWDIDNAVPKSLMDGLVHAKIIKDDCFKYVKGLSTFGNRVKREEEEKTIIEIYEI